MTVDILRDKFDFDIEAFLDCLVACKGRIVDDFAVGCLGDEFRGGIEVPRAYHEAHGLTAKVESGGKRVLDTGASVVLDDVSGIGHSRGGTDSV